MNFSRNSTESTYSWSPGDTKHFSAQMAPELRYFVVDRFAIGLRTPVSYSTSSFMGVKNHSTAFGLGPSMRYYYPLKDRWALIADAGYSFGLQRTKGPMYDDATNSFVTSTVTDSYQTFDFGVGPTYFITKNIGIEAIMSYSSTTTKLDPEYGSKYSSGSLSLNIGLQIYLDRGSK